jgi:hypothetical protein
MNFENKFVQYNAPNILGEGIRYEKMNKGI